MQFPFDKTNPGDIDPADITETNKTSIRLWAKWLATGMEKSASRSVNEEHAKMQCKIIAEKLGDTVQDLTFVTISKQEALDTYEEHYTV